MLLALVALLAFASLACSSESTNLGKYFPGRTLHVNLLSIEEVPELRYATIDPDDIVRHWRMTPSSDELELILIRLKVENHTAINAVFNVDQEAAQLRDFVRGSYFPVELDQRLYQDLRGQGEVSVLMDLGRCFDPNRMYISKGTKVVWKNESGVVHFLKPGPASADLDVAESVSEPIEPGQTYAQDFDVAGIWDYDCATAEGSTNPAQIVIEETSQEAPIGERSFLFINGPFELKQGTGIDGWMVFEAPAGTVFRDFTWLAGDFITVTF